MQIDISKKTSIRLATLLAVALLVMTIVRIATVGSATTVSLKTAQPLAGEVSQALGTRHGDSMPIAGKDYKLTPHYIEGKNWAFVTISPLKGSSFAGSAVLRKDPSGSYEVLLGPGTSFDADQVKALPPDVGSYVVANAAVYTRIAGQ